MNTIADGWASYDGAVLDRNMLPTHREDVQMGFYAGAQYSLNVIARGTAHMSEEAAMAVFRGLVAEGQAFANRLIAESERQFQTTAQQDPKQR